jgi:hypothetical protein
MEPDRRQELDIVASISQAVGRLDERRDVTQVSDRRYDDPGDRARLPLDRKGRSGNDVWLSRKRLSGS